MISFFKNLSFENEITSIKTLFEYFFGGKLVFFIIFLLSIEYIWFKEEEKKIKHFFTLYVIFIFLVIWNPICIYILKKFINYGALYRIYYMLPMYFTIAVAFTKLVSGIQSKFFKLIGVAIGCVVITFCGNCIFNEWTTIETNNSYKLFDETVEIAEIIYNDNEYKEKRAVVPYGISSQIQQIYPDIYLAYTRIVSNAFDENGKVLPMDTEDASNYPPVVAINTGNVEYLGDYSEKQNLNYIVINKEVELSEDIENIGFEEYKETNEHVIYRKMK